MPTLTERLARRLTHRPVAWLVVVLTAVVLGVCGVLAADVEQDDDVLAFLPESNADIRTFREINERFGSTDIALVGVRVDDPFDGAFLQALSDLTTELRDVPGLDSALTLTNVQDFQKDPAGGIVQGELIDEIPTTREERAALRDKVMSRDHIVGTLISEDADAILVYGFAAPGSQPRDIATRVRAAVERHLPDHDVYWGGGPFISTWIYETTQADMARLIPWAIGAIVVIMMLAFRDLLGTALGLLATVVGIAVSRATMNLLDVSFNIVLSSMPVILFAVGSAYAIHILSHYDQHARKVGATPEAVVRTLVGTGPTVVAAGLTTVAGLLSFVMMDIEPMRTFGVFTALGIFVALLTSLTFVPAVIALFPRPVKSHGSGPIRPMMLGLVRAAREYRGTMLFGVAVCVALGVGYAGSVQSRMDLKAFFDPGSPPDVAQTFLDEAFGGSQFIQLHVRADLEEPGVLREVGRVADAVRGLPHVSGVQTIDDVVAIIGDAMSGARRIPDEKGQVSVLHRFLSSDPSVGRLMTDDRREALLQVKLDTSDADELDVVLEQVEALVASDPLGAYRVVSRDDDPTLVQARLVDVVTRRVQTLARDFGVALPSDAAARIPEALQSPPPAADPMDVAASVAAFLTSDESWVVLEPEQVQPVARAAAQTGATDLDALTTALAEALGVPTDDGTVGDLVLVLEQPLADFERTAVGRARAEALLAALDANPPMGAAGERFTSFLAARLQDLSAPTALAPSTEADAPTLQWTVSGMPVLYRGLAASVTASQFKSLGFALGLVFLIMVVYYRSIPTGLLATAPTAITLLVVWGGMGLAGVHLDIGTMMIASIIIGAGVDYGVHLLAAWHAPPGDALVNAAQRAVDETSHGIWTNAIMVAAGFFVLTLGDARPLQNVGLLTATAMLAAALSTFIVIPLFASKREYKPRRHVVGD